VPVLVTWCGLVFISNHHLIFAAAVAFIQRKFGTTPLLFEETREIHYLFFSDPSIPFSAMPDHVMCEKFGDFGYIIIYKNGKFIFLKKQNETVLPGVRFLSPPHIRSSCCLHPEKIRHHPSAFRREKRDPLSLFSDPSFPFSAMPDHVLCEKFIDFGYISYTKMEKIFFLKKTKWKLYGMHNKRRFRLWVIDFMVTRKTRIAERLCMALKKKYLC
jgi:hypothetical protein